MVDGIHSSGGGANRPPRIPIAGRQGRSPCSRNSHAHQFLPWLLRAAARRRTESIRTMFMEVGRDERCLLSQLNARSARRNPRCFAEESLDRCLPAFPTPSQAYPRPDRPQNRMRFRAISCDFQRFSAIFSDLGLLPGAYAREGVVAPASLDMPPMLAGGACTHPSIALAVLRVAASQPISPSCS